MIFVAGFKDNTRLVKAVQAKDTAVQNDEHDSLQDSTCYH